MISSEQLARLHLVNTLFHSLTGHDLYLAGQLLGAVEAAQKSGLVPASEQEGDLADTLAELHRHMTGVEPEARFTFLDGAAPGAAGPLWLREQLLRSLKKNATADRSTVFVANLDAEFPAVRAKRRRAKLCRTKQRIETIDHLRELAAKRANPRSHVTLLIV